MTIRTDVTEADFHRAILAEPGDDVHRLVYADWLDEHAGGVPCPQCWNRFFGGRCDACDGSGRVPDGRAARAEFVRVQCELAGPHPVEVRTWHLRRRERELLAAHAGAWFGVAGMDFADVLNGNLVILMPDESGESAVGWLLCSVGRGFLVSIQCGAAAWLAHGDAIRAAQPVTRVTLVSAPWVVGRGARFGLKDDPDARLYHGRDLFRDGPGDMPRSGDPALWRAYFAARLLPLRFPGIHFRLVEST
jgi:uncharacterized protein (TIGR02996 family)